MVIESTQKSELIKNRLLSPENGRKLDNVK